MATYLRSAGVGPLSFAALSAVLIAVKWIAIGRFKEEAIPIWSNRYARFWIAQAAIRTNPLNLFVGTPLYNAYLRLLGAKVGKGAVILSMSPTCTDLISIGDRAFVSEATVFEIGSSIGPDAQPEIMSALIRNQHLAGGERYQGCSPVGTSTDFIRVSDGETPTDQALIYTICLFLTAALITAPLAIVFAYLLGVWGLAGNSTASEAELLISSAAYGIPELTGFAVVFYFGLVAFSPARSIIMPKIYNLFFKAEKEHPLFGFQYWLYQRISVSSNNLLLKTLFGDSALIMPYYRAVGYDLSQATENGSNFGVSQRQYSPFLCKFNRNTLVSDGLALVNLNASRSTFRLSTIEVPADAYLGNAIHYPTGAKIGSNALLATKVYVPIDGEPDDNIGLLGSPPFEIPRSVTRDGRFDHYKKPGIFEERLKMKLKLNLITLALFVARACSGVLLIKLLRAIRGNLFAEQMAASTITVAAVIAVIALFASLVVPLYFVAFEAAVNFSKPTKPRICSLYERPFWDHERFWKMNQNIALMIFDGTRIKSWLLKIQGVKIGKKVFDNGTAISEPYMVEIGDHACLNSRVSIQRHSLEDGTFKSDRIKIGGRCTLMSQSFSHCDAVLGDDVLVETDAFVMKGADVGDEELWSGNPVRTKI